jgi:hypothetical protein
MTIIFKSVRLRQEAVDLRRRVRGWRIARDIREHRRIRWATSEHFLRSILADIIISFAFICRRLTKIRAGHGSAEAFRLFRYEDHKKVPQKGAQEYVVTFGKF